MDGSTLSAGTGAPTKPSITAPISPDKKSHSGATNNTLQPITNSPNQPVTPRQPTNCPGPSENISSPGRKHAQLTEKSFSRQILQATKEGKRMISSPPGFRYSSKVQRITVRLQIIEYSQRCSSTVHPHRNPRLPSPPF